MTILWCTNTVLKQTNKQSDTDTVLELLSFLALPHESHAEFFCLLLLCRHVFIWVLVCSMLLYIYIHISQIHTPSYECHYTMSIGSTSD